MKYTEVKNIVWADSEHTLIVCDVTFETIGTVPFSPNPNDTAEHSVEIYNRIVGGEFGAIGEYVEPPVSEVPTENQIPVALTGTDGGIL